MLEPSAGDGALLAALARRSRAPRTYAVERDPHTATLLTDLAGEVHCDEYLRHAAEVLGARRFDAVIGNPPYIRYQYLEPDVAARAEALLAEVGIPTTRHMNAWVPFLVEGVRRLSPGGRVAMLVPAELLQVRYTAGLRSWLLAELQRAVIVCFRDLVFPGVQQEIVAFLGEKGPGPAALQVVDLPDLAALSAFDPEDAGPAATPSGKWTSGWLDPGLSAEVSTLLARAPRLGDLARVEVGVVTGANGFFTVDAETRRAHALEHVTHRLLGRSADARGLRFTEADHAENAAAGRRAWLADLPSTHDDPHWTAWLGEGEKAGLPARYKCRIRTPWWAIPSVWAAPVALFKRCDRFTRLIRNEIGAVSTDTAYRVRPRGAAVGREDDLVGSFLNSLTWLSVELHGRSYGGGVLELIPSEIAELALPLTSLPAEALADADRLLREQAAPEVLLDRMDPIVLHDFAKDERAALRRAWRQLADRRINRRRSPRSPGPSAAD